MLHSWEQKSFLMSTCLGTVTESPRLGKDDLDWKKRKHENLKKNVKENILRISDCLEGNENKINLEFVDFNLIFYDLKKRKTVTKSSLIAPKQVATCLVVHLWLGQLLQSMQPVQHIGHVALQSQQSSGYLLIDASPGNTARMQSARWHTAAGGIYAHTWLSAAGSPR